MKIIFLILSVIFLQTTDTNAQTKWKSFTNKNGFTIKLPDYFKEGLLVAGETLQYYDNTIDEKISVTIESFGLGTMAGLKASYESDLKSFTGVTYNICKTTWYVISGKDEEGIFYHKTIIKKGILHHLKMSYPAEQKERFDKILPKIASSFK